MPEFDHSGEGERREHSAQQTKHAVDDHQQFALAKAAGAAFHVLKPYDATVVGEAFVDAGVIVRAAVPAPQGRAVS